MTSDLGIVGLGVMGANLAMNFAEKDFHVSVFNRTTEVTKKFVAAQKGRAWESNIYGCYSINEFVQSLKAPRKVFILVKAGAPTEATIDQLTKTLSPNDIIIDCGNAHFKDQAARASKLEQMGFRFLAMGISGGEEGARKGPAFFPGGTLSVWEEIRPIVEAAAARSFDGTPCVTMNGRGGAGSCVKMYHNAGEYAILQIWAETFDILSTSGMTNDDIASLLESWKRRALLDSYMLDISIEVAKAKEGSEALVNQVMDTIGSKGTGLWSVQEALEIGCPAPSLNMAVISRQVTMQKEERIANASFMSVEKRCPPIKRDSAVVEDLYRAVQLAIISSYAQTFQCLRAQDNIHKFGFNLPAIIGTFGAGCILQGYLLKPMTEVFRSDPDIPNLLCGFTNELSESLNSYRRLVGYVSERTAVSIPVLSASLFYINSMFTEVLKYGQFVQLQRDVFGRHGFERLDREGTFNHNWPELQ